jgi:hypothetical protein
MRAFSLFLLAMLLGSGGTARAAPDLLVGVTEDALKFDPQPAYDDARKLGIKAFRITLLWQPGLTEPTAEQTLELERAVGVPRDITIVLSVFGRRAVHAPTTEERRDEYCGFLESIVRRYRRIRQLGIWNEPNKSYFWRPQFNGDGTSAAPAAYAALLARCWDVLHDARAGIRVIAPSTSPRGNDKPDAVSNISHSPTLFIRELGRAYRASGRDSPIFDIVGHHVHGISSAERPWRTHRGSSVTQGDLTKLDQTLSEAFSDTAQPVPGRCIDGKCVPVWWLEAGFQTEPDPDKASFYTGVEVTPRSLPDSVGDVELEPLPDSRSLAPDQATQIVSALRLAYCQPHVEAFFNFLLWDEARLEGWQSAPIWVDRTPKGSYEAFRGAIREVRSGDVDCDELRRAVASQGADRPGRALPQSADSPARDEDDGFPLWSIAAGAAAALVAGGALIFLRRRRRPRPV